MAICIECMGYHSDGQSECKNQALSSATVQAPADMRERQLVGVDHHTNGVEVAALLSGADVTNHVTDDAPPTPIAVIQELLHDPMLHFSSLGEEVLAEAMLVASERDPMMMMGVSGTGKTVIVQEIARRLGYTHSAHTNAYPQMDISLWIGQWLPDPLDGSGVSVRWLDGILTAAIRRGWVFFMEELTRAPQDALARLFSVLDMIKRSYHLPENGGEQVPVHDDFLFISTANPAGGQYATVKLDKALMSRFAAIWDVNEPMADESTLLRLKLPTSEYADMADRLVSFVTDTRRNRDTSVNTRDILHCANRIAQGFTPMRAVQLSILPKYENQSAIIQAAEASLVDSEEE